jgi:hypothetical protein
MWEQGNVVMRREVLNDGRTWLEMPVIVVRDDDELLATYIASGAPLRFPAGPWPTANGLHPWHGKERWSGNGVLMLQRPDEMHAIFVFWEGAMREFAGWYVNFQDPFRRSEDGYATQDLELDIWIPTGSTWRWKDEELLDLRVREGRFTHAQADAVRAEGARVAKWLDAGAKWWDDAWASWLPDPNWPTPEF